MDVVPCRLVKQTTALFTKTYLRRLLNLQRDTTISADTLTMYAINDMVDHVTALRVMKERFELSHLHLLALQRCNKQSQLGRISSTSYTRVKSVALTLDGFHISSWLFRLVKLLVNIQRFPDAYSLEKRELENAVYTLLLSLDPSYFDAEEVFFVWQITALCSSWTQIEAMTEHFALRDAVETLSSEQFAELLNLLCNIRHNSFSPEDQEAFVQLKKRYPTFTKEELEQEEEKYAKVEEERRQSREASVQAYSWERTRANPLVQSMCVADEVEGFLQDRCVIVSHGYRILREVIGEKYAWERCIEVLRDTSLDAMFARERIISVLPLLASSTQFWPSVELNPKHQHKHHHHQSEEQEQITNSSKMEKEQELEEEESYKCEKEKEDNLENTTNVHQDSSAECVNTTSNQSTLTSTSTTLTNTDTRNTQHDMCRMNAETNKSVRERITKLFYKPIVYGQPGRGALLYEELPWLFDEKSWRSYFPVSGSDALRELYTVNINQFAFRVAAVYGKVNVELPNYVQESYEKPIEANLWRHICERDVDTIGQFALMSIRRFDIIHAPFVFSEQLRKHMEHVVRDRWGVVLSKTTEAKEKEKESNNTQENDTHKINSSSSKTNSNNGKENNLNAYTQSMEHVVVSDNINNGKQDNGNKEVEQESENSKLIASNVNNNNNNSTQEEFMDNDDKDDAQHGNVNEEEKINSQEEIETFADSSDNENKSTEETSTNNKKKTNDNHVDNSGRNSNKKENSSSGDNKGEPEEDDMDYELESEPALPAYVHGARQREMREQRMALKRLSRSNHHHILKTLLIAVESQCSLEVVKPLLHTLINMMQEILKPTVMNKWNGLYAQRVPLAQDACRIDWPTIETLIKNYSKAEQERISKSNNSKNGIVETNKESNRRFNHDVYVSSDLYDRPIDLEWSLWSVAHTAYTLTMMESCFHGKPILSSDIRGMFCKPCSKYNSSGTDILNKSIQTIVNDNKENSLIEALPPLMDVQSDAEAAAMKAQLNRLCLASLRGAIATDRITARSLCSVLMCAPQTLREMKMMYELLSLAALHARDGFSRSQLFCLVHCDHLFEADETWRRHMLKVALDYPIRMWM